MKHVSVNKNLINSPGLSPIAVASTPSVSRLTPGSAKAKNKFSTPPKMQFNKLHVKPVVSPLATASPAMVSPSSATSATRGEKATSVTTAKEATGTNAPVNNHEMAKQSGSATAPSSGPCSNASGGNQNVESGAQKSDTATPPAQPNAKVDGNSPFLLIKSPNSQQVQ